MRASLSAVFLNHVKGGKKVGSLLKKTSFFHFFHFPSCVTNLNYGKGVLSFYVNLQRKIQLLVTVLYGSPCIALSLLQSAFLNDKWLFSVNKNVISS